MIRVGVQTAGWYSEKDIDGSIKFIKECGFNAIDFNIDHKLPGTKIQSGELTEFFNQDLEALYEFYRPLKEACEKYDVQIGQMHAPFPVWVKDMDAVNDYMIMVIEKICAICKYVGCPAFVVHPISRSTNEKEIETNLALYRRMIPGAKKYGVKICLENIFSRYKDHIIEGRCSDVRDACMYIDTLNAEAGEELFGFCLDVGHANLTAKNLYEYIKTLGHRLTILHIHDNDARTDLHQMPYTHTVNWEGFIEGLRTIDFRGTLGFETFRVMGTFPKEVHPSALRLISDIGWYFASRIEAPKEEA